MSDIIDACVEDSMEEMNNDVSWKRVVQGVSESCDVCDATLFNLHWACPRCGFVVCLECYVSRKKNSHTNLLNGETKSDTSSSSSSATKDDKDKYFWLLCTNKSQHDLDKLMLTQIVAGDALEELDKKLNNCGVKFRLANKLNNGQKSSKQNGNLNGNNGGGAGSGDTGSSDNSNSGNGKGASLRDLIGSEQKVKMSDIIDACVEDSMEEMNNDVSWKRVVQGVSESCDVCDATLFNLHWACPRCGFVVCLECYVSRKKNSHTNLLNGETKSMSNMSNINI